MSTSDNKQFIESVFRQWEEAGDLAPLLDALSEDLVWIVTGTSPISGTYHGKQAWREQVIEPLQARLATSIGCKLIQVIAEGNDVVVLWEGDATSVHGTPYAQEYCWVLRVEDRSITLVKGFYDTRLVTELFQDDDSRS